MSRCCWKMALMDLLEAQLPQTFCSKNGGPVLPVFFKFIHLYLNIPLYLLCHQMTSTTIYRSAMENIENPNVW